MFTGGLAWIKSFNVGLGICAVLVHVVAIFLNPYYWSMLIYIRQRRTIFNAILLAHALLLYIFPSERNTI
jgi:hypothetical protein